ncbi:unnamed protein product, partial [marine sediment metagenome]
EIKELDDLVFFKFIKLNLRESIVSRSPKIS